MLVQGARALLRFGAALSPRRATYLFLLRQNKVSQKKATLLSASLRCAAGSLRCSVQPGSSSNSARQSLALIRLALRSSAQTEGFLGAGSDSGSECSQVDATVFKAGVVRDRLRVLPTLALRLSEGLGRTLDGSGIEGSVLVCKCPTPVI